MVMIPLTHVKPGERLTQDICSVLGGLIMTKDRVLSFRDIEVLRAFMIEQVEVARSQPNNEAPVQPSPRSNMYEAEKFAVHLQQQSQEERAFAQQWKELAGHVTQMMEPSAVVRIPILNLRSILEKLIDRIDQYQPMAVRVHLSELAEEEISDKYFIHKSIAVSLTSYLMGQWSGKPVREGMQIALAGLLHDIGMIKVNKDILNKEDALTTSEMNEIRRHAQLGYEILRNTSAINDGVKLAALQHHERIDGEGYPLGIQGEKIHPYAKIVAIADVFHAIAFERRYKKAQSPFLALEQLQEASFGKLDPQLVLTFIQKVSSLTQGTAVKLNDGRMGRIVFIDHQYPTRPWVSVNGTIERLSQDKHLWIESILAI